MDTDQYVDKFGTTPLLLEGLDIIDDDSDRDDILYTLLRQWNLIHLHDSFREKDIDVLVLLYMKERHIDKLSLSFRDEVMFEHCLQAWQKEQTVVEVNGVLEKPVCSCSLKANEKSDQAPDLVTAAKQASSNDMIFPQTVCTIIN